MGANIGEVCSVQRHSNLFCCYCLTSLKKYAPLPLTGVAQWVGHHPTNQKVTGSIPSQGTLLGFRPGPRLGMCERQLIDVFLIHTCFYPSLPLPLRINFKNIFKNLFIDFRERGRERERNIHVREKHRSTASLMLFNWGLNLQLRHVR